MDEFCSNLGRIVSCYQLKATYIVKPICATTSCCYFAAASHSH